MCLALIYYYVAGLIIYDREVLSMGRFKMKKRKKEHKKMLKLNRKRGRIKKMK